MTAQRSICMRKLYILLSVAVFFTGCDASSDHVLESSMAQSNVAPPTAEVRPVTLEKHGDTRIDNYFWLRERENPEVIAYLEAENAYTDSILARTGDLQDSIFEEIKGRIKEDDASVPYFDNGYWYYTRYEEGGEYPIFCRKKGTLEAERRNNA